MPSFLSHILPGFGSLNSSSSSGSHVTDAPDIARVEIGPAAVHLQEELRRLYWAGVKRELPHILLTLRQWHRRSEFANTVLDDELDQHMHGYDTFIDQVSHSSRQFSQRQAQSPPSKEERRPDGLPSYTEALENRGWDYFAEMKSNRVKEAIRESLGERGDEDVLRRRARMLLQSLQLLDVDKVIEYREPEKVMSFWKRPAPPQLMVSSLDQSRLPIFTPKHCSECRSVIRGSTFTNLRDEGIAVCEGCYRARYYGQPEFTKHYKSCCLPKAITPEVSRRICHCSSIRRRDNHGRPVALWPMEKKNMGHLNGGTGRVSCGLLELTDMVAEAKYAATRFKVERNITLEEVKRSELAFVKEPDEQPRPSKLKTTTTATAPEFGSSYGFTTDSPEEVPFYIRSVTDKYPYGNVHMALRLGPIIIENGVANTHGGVLITSRDPPRLQVLRDSPTDIEHSLLLTGKTERTLYSQRRARAPKRYKAMMKQVVGGAFCGFFDQNAENELVDALVFEARQLIDEGLGTAEKAIMMERSTTRLLTLLKQYLSSRLETYISSIVGRLLDPKVQLRWDFQWNNCQTFCDNLIDRNVFGALFASPVKKDVMPASSLPSSGPLYLISFVCRPGAYVKEKTKSKFDVPNGLTEEYLLKFRYGRHDESDLIDTLAEYWYDWSGFQGPIYRYQDVFPWDCTEAYGRYPVSCGECNISKHIMAFPFDSMSIMSLHLARGRHLYPKHPLGDNTSATTSQVPPTASSPAFPSGHMSDLEWFCNRLTVLLAQDAFLTVASAMAKCSIFRESTHWLHIQQDERQDRLKLGGIHRAQPFSHHFERGAYHQYFVADWVSLQLPLRIEAYETLRDWRAAQGDVGRNSDGTDDGGGCGGCGGFGCGAMAGCAGGCEANGGDTCGSGCVSGDGGCDGGGCGGGCGGCGGGCGG